MTDERSAETAAELDALEKRLRGEPWDGEMTFRALRTKAADAIRSLRKQLDEARAREAQMVAALAGIRQYGSDTLSGRVDGPDDREWQRSAVQEMTRRANAGLSQEPPASPSPVLRDAVIEEALEIVGDITERADAMGLGLVKYPVENVRTLLAALAAADRSAPT